MRSVGGGGGPSHTFSGAALLHAFVLGVEVECRLGNAVSPGHYKRGWHITSTCGVFGAAAASKNDESLGRCRTEQFCTLTVTVQDGHGETLVDAFTIRRHLGTLDGLTVTVVGDVDPAVMEAQVKRLFGALLRPSTPAPWPSRWSSTAWSTAVRQAAAP